ncbi:MAG: alpha/beta hydrolase [Clostridiales bacterium]|nr:alpha/beta hydrolase [Clostridiales bacterium]
MIVVLIYSIISLFFLIFCETNIYCWLLFLFIVLSLIIGWKKYMLKRKTMFILLIPTLCITLLFIGKEGKVSVMGSLTREVYGRFLSNTYSDIFTRDAEKIKEENIERYNGDWSIPEGYTNDVITMDNFKMELIKNTSSDSNKVILQLHGGGYVFGLDNSYRDIAVRYSKLSMGAAVLTPDYRVGTISPYPAALNDAVEAYKWLIEHGYKGENIIVVGDSAGGGLALGTVLYLKDNNIELPAGVITMSAWTNLGCDSESYKNNVDKDVIFGPILGANSDFNPSDIPYVGNNNIKDPYLSPFYGDYEGFPKMLMQVGTNELLYDDTINVYEKAKSQGVDVKETTYYGMFHCFQLGGDKLPEGTEAWKEVEEFINSI